jgi:tRNA(Arg) A34 adenosine deaminase TadA
VEAVLARQRQGQNTAVPVTNSERKTGVKHAEVVTARLVQDERGWLRLAG